MIHDHLNPPPSRRPALEPMLPLINVVFLLLMFFMIAGQLAPRYDVEAARTALAMEEEDRQLATLVINPAGELTLNDQPTQSAQLAEQLGDDPQQVVRVVADGNIALEKLRDLLSTLRELGVSEVRLVTRGEQ